jgi:hypothetical protein
VIIKLAQVGFGVAVVLQAFVSASDKAAGAANKEAVVVKFAK